MIQTMTQAVADRVDYDRFHEIFGSDIQIALALTIEAGVEWSTQIPEEHLKELVYRSPNGDFTRLYFPAVNNADMIRQNDGQVIFPSLFSAKEARSYYLSFWAESIKAKGFWVRMARFDEEHTFGFPEDKKPFIHLVILDERVQQFRPLFIKARNRKFEENSRPEVMAFRLDVVFVEQGVAVNVTSISESECPPQLVADNP